MLHAFEPQDHLQVWRIWFRSRPKSVWDWWVYHLPSGQLIGTRKLEPGIRQALRRAVAQPGVQDESPSGTFLVTQHQETC